MTDIARNVRTGEICSAAERDIREDIREDAFTCVGCTAEMRPVAVAPGEAYWVAPHFRVRGLHDDDCDGDGTPVAAPAARRHGQPRRNQPGLTPTRLRLANENAPAGLQAGPEDPGAAPGHAVGGLGGEAGPGRQDNVAGTLHRIAQCFLELIDDEDPPLALPGCIPGTYRGLFELLKADARQAYDRKVYYDAISFQRYDVDDAMMEIDVLLGPSAYRYVEHGRRAVAGRFRVHFDMHGWTDRRRVAFLASLRRAKERQMAMRDEGVGEKILLFFLGTQDPGDATLFHVDDVRLACFLTGPA